MNRVKPVLHLIHTAGMPIMQQLQWEEALLRADNRNWCLINEGTTPSIVLGISGKVDQHVEETSNTLPLIRRFSGGGTVVVNEHTLFVTFIFNEADIGVSCTPGTVMQWTASFHQPLFAPHPFQLRENDFVIGERKCGGNAQYLCRGRWLQHTSFLWDYNPTQMAFLKKPPKMPGYRENRDHEAFVCRLGEYLCQKSYLEKLREKLRVDFELVDEVGSVDILEILERPHRRSTKILMDEVDNGRHGRHGRSGQHGQ